MGISVQKTNASILYPCPVMLWLLCALSYFAISADGVKSVCNAGSVRIGEEAKITCRFEEDISKTQHDVRLFYNTTPVLVIAWSDGYPEIHTKHGYRFDGKINDTLTLEIPDAKLDQAGLYACHIVLSDANDASPCTLNVTGDWYITTAKDPCPAKCSTSSTFTSTCISNDNTTVVYKIVIAILTGILGVFVSISSAFIALYIRQKRKWIASPDSERDSEQAHHASKFEIASPDSERDSEQAHHSSKFKNASAESLLASHPAMNASAESLLASHPAMNASAESLSASHPTIVSIKSTWSEFDIEKKELLERDFFLDKTKKELLERDFFIDKTNVYNDSSFSVSDRENVFNDSSLSESDKHRVSCKSLLSEYDIHNFFMESSEREVLKVNVFKKSALSESESVIFLNESSSSESDRDIRKLPSYHEPPIKNGMELRPLKPSPVKI